jgi:UDP-N-acetylmuramoylalanine--D-glutamate ligase
VPVHFGSFNTDWFDQANQLVVNPGIAISTPEIQQAQRQGTEIVGDIELFAREVSDSKPVVAITGSNGKTTVTTLLDLMAKKSGIKVGTGGNIGTPALDLLADDVELYVLELSSFQLETTSSLHTVAAVVLNVSEDHLDRYDYSLEQYALSKAEIYRHCQHVICNRDDNWSMRLANDACGYKSLITFGLGAPQQGHFGVIQSAGKDWLVKGNELLMPCDEIKLPGSHNLSNALAALALGDSAGLKMSAMLDVLREYAGMEHRTQWLGELAGVNWYNDSKGTNVGATIAALSGLPGKTVLIAGGQGKGADFFPLKQVVEDHARAVVLIGEDAGKIADVLVGFANVVHAGTMDEAVKLASQLAQEGDNVLLSPACASFDMFSNYMERGQVFMELVSGLAHKEKAGENHV